MDEDAVLAALLSVWRAEVCSTPLPTLVTLEEAVRVIEAVRGDSEPK